MLSQTKSFQLASVTALHASTNYPQEISTPILNGAVLKVDVTGVTGAGSALDLTLQTSLDGGSHWLDLAALTQITATTTNSIFVTLPVANTTTLCGEVGDGTLSAGQVSHLPLLSPSVRLKSMLSGSAAYFSFSANLLIPEVPTIA